MGQGFGSSGAAAAGADALEQVLRRKFAEVQANREYQLQRDQLAEQQRQRQAVEQQQAENAGFLNEQRAAAAAKIKSETDATAARRTEMDTLLADPTVPEATKRWMRGAAVGWNQLTPHDYEDPAVHQAHVSADAQRKIQDAIDQHAGIRNFDIAHPLPVRALGARVLRQDDPSLPLGAQRYLAQIASKHGSDVNGATAELSAYLNDPHTQAAHPNLSPVKAMEALGKLMKGTHSAAGAAADALDQLVSQAFNGAGRGAAPGAAARIVNGRLVGASSPQASIPPAAAAPDAQLTERARQVLQQGGYATTPENIQKFLSNPANRQRLMGGQ